MGGGGGGGGLAGRQRLGFKRGKALDYVVM